MHHRGTTMGMIELIDEAAVIERILEALNVWNQYE
jgi:hypothetical protein